MKIHLRHGPRLYPDERPRIRGECLSMPRPCPFVSCRYHLAIDVHRDFGSNLRLTVINDDPTTMANTCALDVADGHYDLPEKSVVVEPHEEAAETTLHQLTQLLGGVIGRERVRQTLEHVQKELRKGCAQSLEDYEVRAPEDFEPPKRPTDLQRAQAIVLRQLRGGPTHLTQLVEECWRDGIGVATTKHAVRVLSSTSGNTPPRIIGPLKTGLPRGTWTIVDGRQANIRHTGHPGKAGRSD